MIKHITKYVFLFIIFFTTIAQGQDCFVSRYSNTIFFNREYIVKLSVYNVDSSFYNDSIEDNYAIISGDIFIRDDYGKFSGEKDSLFFTLNPPKLYIVELQKEIVLTQGYFKETLPAGSYNILLYWDYYFPIHHKLELKNKEEKSVSYYFGGYGIF